MYTLSPQQNSPKRILFHLLGKISSTKWISSVKDGFRCVALLHYPLNDRTTLEMTKGTRGNDASFFVSQSLVYIIRHKRQAIRVPDRDAVRAIGIAPLSFLTFVPEK